MVLHDPQEFGGLEEYAATLAVSLKQQGQSVSVLSTTWVPDTNQYINRLRENGVEYVQVPWWLSLPASHWPTKERLLKIMLQLLSPLIVLLTIGLKLFRKVGWQQAWRSAHGWTRGQLLFRLIGPIRYKPLTIFLLNWWKLRWRPDVIHIQGYTTGLLFVIGWAYKRRIPVIYEEHQTPDPQFDWWQGFHHSINKATTVVAVSEKSAQGLRDVCKVTRPIVVRKPLLPDPLKFGWGEGIRPDGETGKLQITTVARLVEAKGLEFLLESAVPVLKDHPYVKFSVFGDGPLRQKLIDYGFELGLDATSIFPGAFTDREELAAIMAGTDIFVMSSVLEGQPLGVVEAMAYGRPIVATNVGGIPELITDGINGLLCPSRDPVCLGEKLDLLIKNPSIRFRLGQKARQTYERGGFQPEDAADHFIKIYRAALQNDLSPPEFVEGKV